MDRPELRADERPLAVPPVLSRDDDVPATSVPLLPDVADVVADAVFGRRHGLPVTAAGELADTPFRRFRVGLRCRADALPGEQEAAVANPLHGPAALAAASASDDSS